MFAYISMLTALIIVKYFLALYMHIYKIVCNMHTHVLLHTLISVYALPHTRTQITWICMETALHHSKVCSYLAWFWTYSLPNLDIAILVIGASLSEPHMIS